MEKTVSLHTIREWAPEDRPREKLIQYGASVLSNTELLAILLRSGTPEFSAIDLARAILKQMDENLPQLAKLKPIEMTKQFRGVGEAKAAAIAAAFELGKRRALAERLEREEIKCSRDAYEFFYPMLSDLPHEELWLLMMNQSAKVIGKEQISKGGVSETVADMRLILRPVITHLASSVILCHNHPSGNTKPSLPDTQLTRKVKEACRLFGVRLNDHIILTDGDYFSYADEGII